MPSTPTLNSKGGNPLGNGITVAAGSNAIDGCFIEIDVCFFISYMISASEPVSVIQYESKFAIDVIKYKVIQNI